MALFLALLLSACTSPALEEAPSSSERAASAVQAPPPLQEKIVPLSAVEQLALDWVKILGLPGMEREEAVRTAYRFLVEQIYFADPVGLDSWRYLSDQDASIPYVENRALSPLLFGIGSCEDFAAAMVMLLQADGFAAEYVAGYTLSVEQVYIDHAWAVVQLNGQWYHLDPQLEQNVVRGDRLTYRYYLRSDEELEIDHKWGQNLIDYWPNMPEAEKGRIRQLYTPPLCPQSGPHRPPEIVSLPPQPNMTLIQAEIGRLRTESKKGILPTLQLNVEPPILVAEHHVTPPLDWAD